ncbi:TPA: helix-turn-helix domain-containing protein [Clostridium perfringens]|uniref:helix-turn-helix transcriptional regulator n=1 Tax=Clostridium perfringens TaxID=1502 RepID=UPI0024BC34DB|nr:helix-turn-helix domain-containing protein [Clostridium perfringens]
MLTNKDLGLTIFSLRNASNLTQEELAKKANIHRLTLGDIERGTCSPSFEVLKNIAFALDIELYELFSPIAERKSFKIHQPLNGTFGDCLLAELKNTDYKRLSITVAYAKNSGVARLKPALEDFKSNGGEINMYVGIDQFNTTYEALKELYKLSTNLYIIHNESFSHTYHHKVYMLDKNIISPEKVWLAIGSNNLTAGGLFINYESCSIDILNTNNKYDEKSYSDTLSLFDRYADADTKISLLIESELQIDTLLNENYLKTENQTRFTSIKSSARSTTKTPLFGKESYKAPSVMVQTPPIDLIVTSPPCEGVNSHNSSFVSTIDSDEIYWFEMRKSTGGSRNILDLSSTGKLRSTKPIDSKYYIDDKNTILGGVTFFDINPNSYEIIKNITITYNGNDYYPSTLLYTSNNGSWRLQLKGESVTDDNALSQYGISDFVDNILIFHKVTSSHYILEVYDGSHLENLKSSSIFWATNGINSSSKSFGKLK